MPIGKDLALIAAGPLAGIINAFGAKKVHRWTITNLDSGEKVEGQFGPISPTETPGGSEFGDHISLNRDKPITQYLHGGADGFSFTAMWFARHEADDTPEKRIDVLKQWGRRDDTLLRPPRVSFTVGDGKLIEGQWFLKLGAISYFDPPKDKGGIRGVTVPVTLKEYTPWSLTSEPAPETRYHRAKLGDYYELIAWFEYRDTTRGDIVRQRNPEKLVLQEADVVPLPSIEAIRTIARVPRSITFAGVTKNKESDQKALRQLVQDRNDQAYTSGTVPEGL